MPIIITKNLNFTEVKDFYMSCNHQNAPQTEDEVLTAQDDEGKIIGVVRLCFENGVYVLRTMEVAPQAQRQGIGTKLLDAFKDLLGPHECYCVAYSHLDYFYGKIGFKVISLEEGPLFLKERIIEYSARPEAKEFILMKKSAN